MKSFFTRILAAITFKAWRDRREAAKRRRRYDQLKSMIVKEHLAGRGGMIVPKGFDRKDLTSFTPPMYFHAKNQDMKPVIFWRKELMTEEIGPPLAERAIANGKTSTSEVDSGRETASIGQLPH